MEEMLCQNHALSNFSQEIRWSTSLLCTPSNHRRRKVSKSEWAMASTVARTYNGGLGTEPPAGVQEAEPPVGGQGVKPPEAEAFLAFWTSNECNKFAPFAVFLVCSRFKQQAIEKPIGEYN